MIVIILMISGINEILIMYINEIIMIMIVMWK